MMPPILQPSTGDLSAAVQKHFAIHCIALSPLINRIREQNRFFFFPKESSLISYLPCPQNTLQSQHVCSPCVLRCQNQADALLPLSHWETHSEDQGVHTNRKHSLLQVPVLQKKCQTEANLVYSPGRKHKG